MPALIDFRKGVGESGANAPVQHDDHTHARKEELEWANMSHIEICRAARDNGPGSKVPSRSTYVTGTVPNGPSHAESCSNRPCPFRHRAVPDSSVTCPTNLDEALCSPVGVV